MDLAIAGLVLSILSLLLAVMLFMIALATGNFHLQLGLSSFLTQMSHAKSQAIPPKISTFSALKFFAGDGVGRGRSRRGRGVVFLQSQHARILSRLRVSPVDGIELSGLRRHARRLSVAARACLRALEDNALVVLSLAGLAARGAWFETKKFMRRPAGPFLPPEFFWPLLVVAVVFTVLRNLPAFSFLSP